MCSVVKTELKFDNFGKLGWNDRGPIFVASSDEVLFDDISRHTRLYSNGRKRKGVRIRVFANCNIETFELSLYCEISDLDPDSCDVAHDPYELGISEEKVPQHFLDKSVFSMSRMDILSLLNSEQRSERVECTFEVLLQALSGQMRLFVGEDESRKFKASILIEEEPFLSVGEGEGL